MKSPSPPPVSPPPPPPPNPPMFGADAPKQKAGQGQTLPQPTVLGAALATPAGGTGQRQLLGQ